MIKAGTYKHESCNQRMFCYEVCPPDTIKTWFEDKEGNHDTYRDNWWDLDITPQKFHWLVDQWNEGNVAKVYSHWWEKVDSRKPHINSLLQLSHEELEEVMNFAAFVWPHSASQMLAPMLVPDLRICLDKTNSLFSVQRYL